jgi:hypothetical protein
MILFNEGVLLGLQIRNIAINLTQIYVMQVCEVTQINDNLYKSV